MILYDIRCVEDHLFEGWFNTSDSFQEQRTAKLIECPICGTHDVERMLSAPAVIPSRSKAVAPKSSKQEIAQKEDAESHKFMRKVRKFVETNCDYVGDKFPEKAREIFYGEKETDKGIYGEANADETKDLLEEGIQLAMLPWSKSDA